ncbi:MAG: threonine aldolase family protein [Pseudomonadota bacterium]
MISLLSDTETRPTGAMREAMARAPVGDEQRNLDPTVNELKTRVAELLGKADALWLPGGTMCNLIAIKVHTRPADALISDHMAHILRAEGSGSALASGVMPEAIVTERGIFDPDELRAAAGRLLAVPPPYGTRPTLLCVEQTHNFGGGTVWPLAALQAVQETADELQLKVHMDGARLMNAAVASGVAAREFAACADSVWIDFTKGLGAPIGAVLAGSAEFIAEARRYKQLFGGAMRQAGIAAAGCLYALDEHVERLAEDHANARQLAAALDAMPGVTLRGTPETNIVFFAVDGADHPTLIANLERDGVLLADTGSEIRAVTHLDVDRAGVKQAAAAIENCVRAIRAG